MRGLLLAAALIGVAYASPAAACMASAPLEARDISYADVIVTGRISNYRIVTAKGVDRFGMRPGSFIGDYARFDVVVGEVLKGTAGTRIAVTWDNSTFAEPKTMPPGPYLIALRRPASRIPPLRGPSATRLPDPEPDAMVMLQAPCSSAFIFATTSGEANSVRRLLEGK